MNPSRSAGHARAVIRSAAYGYQNFRRNLSGLCWDFWVDELPAYQSRVQGRRHPARKIPTNEEGDGYDTSSKAYGCDSRPRPHIRSNTAGGSIDGGGLVGPDGGRSPADL